MITEVKPPSKLASFKVLFLCPKIERRTLWIDLILEDYNNLLMIPSIKEEKAKIIKYLITFLFIIFSNK